MQTHPTVLTTNGLHPTVDDRLEFVIAHDAEAYTFNRRPARIVTSFGTFCYRCLKAARICEESPYCIWR